MSTERNTEAGVVDSASRASWSDNPKKKGVNVTPALGTPEEVFYFFLAFFAVEAFFLAMLFASSLSGVRAEGAGPFSTNRKLELLHGSLSPFRAPARSRPQPGHPIREPVAGPRGINN
jgi:hypothetical protein